MIGTRLKSFAGTCVPAGTFCLMVSVFAALAMAGEPGQLFHNEDCTNFFWHRDFPPGKAGEITDRYVDVIADAGATTLLINTNARRTNYKSDAWEAFFDGYDPDGPDDQAFLTAVPREGIPVYRRGVGNMLEVHEQGVDYPARMIARCRHHGISPWITLRMNDCHYNGIPDHPFHGSFWKEHPEFVRQNAPGYYARCLDYKHEEVRDLYKALIAETLSRYDVDGLELDFMREPYVFSPGEEDEGRAILTAWLREIRRMADAAAASKGHAVRLGVRVPSRPETAKALGLDAVAWAHEGLIDLLVATPRWATLEYAIPIGQWRQQLGDADVTLAGGIEVRYQPHPGGPASIVTPELAAGAAVTMLAQGADAVYLFNYFQDGHPAWSRPVYLKTLRAMRSLETLKELPRRVAVTYRDIVAPGESYRPPLPATGAALDFSIVLGPPPSGPWASEIALDCTCESAPDVLVNGQQCRIQQPSKTAEGPDRVLTYAVPSAALKGKTVHQIDVKSVDGKAMTLRRVEMAIAPKE